LIKKYLFIGLKSLIVNMYYNSYLNTSVIRKAGGLVVLVHRTQKPIPLTLVIDQVTIAIIS